VAGSRKRRTEEAEGAPAKKRGKSKRPNHLFGDTTNQSLAETKSIAERRFIRANLLSPILTQCSGYLAAQLDASDGEGAGADKTKLTKKGTSLNLG